MHRIAAAALVLLAACGTGEQAGRDENTASVFSSPPPAAAESVEPAIPDPAATAAALAEMDALDSANARLFRQRQAAMSTKEQCLRQIEGISGEQRKVLETACGRLRSAKDTASR